MLLNLVPLQLAAQQKTERHYRVELIVVRHLSGSSDTAPQADLRDLSAVLDLYAPAEETVGDSADQPAATAEAELLEGQLEEEPAAVAIEDMSDTVREAWRRLRLSAGFRPELFRAWEQSGDSPFPQLRIHDDELLFEIDPVALPPAGPVDEHGALVFSDATVQRQHESDSGLEIGEAPEPPPVTYYYQIDGTATLTRTRFLHLDLDIELREPLYEPVDESEGYANDGNMQPVALGKSGPAASATAFRIHRIAQRRQIQTEEVEYFDGPVIGVLAFVTGYDVPVENDIAAEMSQPVSVP